MKFLERLWKKFKKYFFNENWRCLVCGREIFENEHFCKDCYKELPFIRGPICNHCGRQLNSFQNYCTTCKGVLTNVDLARSVFNYDKPISTLIRKAKYYNGRYILDTFSEYLFLAYCKNYINADVICCVPMTEKSFRKRGYNQSKILAQGVAERVGIPFTDCVLKIKETKRQAKLDRENRLKNLVGAYKVTRKKEISGKRVLIVDDVSTTGATSEALAQKLKKAGASEVYLLTIASVAFNHNRK